MVDPISPLTTLSQKLADQDAMKGFWDRFLDQFDRDVRRRRPRLRFISPGSATASVSLQGATRLILYSVRSEDALASLSGTDSELT